jgi:hypothetical protein
MHGQHGTFVTSAAVRCNLGGSVPDLFAQAYQLRPVSTSRLDAGGRICVRSIFLLWKKNYYKYKKGLRNAHPAFCSSANMQTSTHRVATR